MGSSALPMEEAMTPETITVITGANRGLGRAAALRLATVERHQVVATAREPASLEALAKEVAAAGGRLDCRPLDVADAESAARLAAWLQDRYGRVDVLINNAGIFAESYETSIVDMPLATLHATLDINLFGVLRVTQALAPLLANSRAGRIINLSSGMGQLSDMGTGAPAYRISKTALNAVTRILAGDLAAVGIKVNAVCPGWCRTDMGGESAPRTAEEGIDTVVWLATQSGDGPTGGFFRDRQPIPW
jgi:NAD(P)-dependent dehydrogenase (short-subunit alcohol dehydrogenase family)